MKNSIYCSGRLEFNRMCDSFGWYNDLKIPNNFKIISISGTRDKLHRFLECDKIINLDFDDISHEEELDDIGNRFIGLSNTDAIRLYNFIINNLGNDFIIHCESGRSRSQAIVRFILNNWPNDYIHTTEKVNPCNTPNYFVLGKLNNIKFKLDSVL